jgi:hypothetical protein
MEEAAGKRQEGLAQQLEVLDKAIAVHREALARGSEARADDLIEAARFVTRLEMAGVVKSW